MYHLLFLIILASSLNGYSLSGGVFDSETNEPLENVNITIIGSELGETTDQQGNFQLDDLSNPKITFSLIGYKLFSKNFTNKDALDSKLKIYLEKEPLQWKAVNVMGNVTNAPSVNQTQ